MTHKKQLVLGKRLLAYHYDPLDYAFGGVRVYSNLTFTAGTAVGWFELPGSGGAGLWHFDL